jgi:hypothetical protein
MNAIPNVTLMGWKIEFNDSSLRNQIESDIEEVSETSVVWLNCRKGEETETQ